MFRRLDHIYIEEWRQRIIAWLLAVFLLLSSPAIARSSNESLTYVSSTYLRGMGLSAENWYTIDISRSYFVLCAFMDCLDVWTADETILAAEALNYDALYMFTDDEDVNMWLFGKKGILMFLFDTETNEAHYAVADIDNVYLKADRYMEALRDIGDVPPFSKISSSDVMKLMDSHS